MKNIYFLSSHEDDELFAKEIAKLTGSAFTVLDEPAEIADKLQDPKALLMISDLTDKDRLLTLEKMIRSNYRDPFDLNRVHNIVSPDRMNINDPDPARSAPSGGNFIIRRYNEGPLAAAAVYAKIVRATAQDKAFRLHDLLADGTPVVKYSLEKSADRDQTVQSAQKFFLDSGTEPRIAMLATNSVDELLMNAIFDAPKEGNRRPLHNSAPRTSDFTFDKKHHVEVYLGIDQDNILISVVDRFGSLDRETILEHLTRNMKSNPYTVRPNSMQSNGLGLALLFKSGASVLVSSEKDQRTEVVILLRRVASYRAFRSQLQFISTQIFADEGGILQ